jgi:WD40 repeat protein
MAFSPDSKALANGSLSSIVQLWNAATGQQIGNPIVSGGGYVNTVAFSPDSETLAMGSSDGTVNLWDVATSQQIGALLGGTSDSIGQLVFTQDGSILEAIVGNTYDRQDIAGNTIEQWDVAYLPNPARYLCASTGGSVTRVQWARYIPELPYENVCP